MSDRDRIAQVVARYLAAYESHDAIGCGAFFASDALVLSPWSPPARGRDAIAAAHLDWFAEGETNKVMTIEDCQVDGDIAVCLIRYNADVAGQGGGVEKVFGASLNTLQRQPDASWQIRYTSLNELPDIQTGSQP